MRMRGSYYLILGGALGGNLLGGLEAAHERALALQRLAERRADARAARAALAAALARGEAAAAELVDRELVDEHELGVDLADGHRELAAVLVADRRRHVDEGGGVLEQRTHQRILDRRAPMTRASSSSCATSASEVQLAT